jgi:hypothetical protein
VERPLTAHSEGRLFASPSIVVGVEPKDVGADDLDESRVMRPVATLSDAVIVGRVWLETPELVRRVALSLRAPVAAVGRAAATSETILPRMYRRAVVLLLFGLTFAVTPLSPAAPGAGGTFRVAEPATYIDSIDGALAGFAGDPAFLDIVCASLMRLPDKPLPAGFRVVPELAAGFPRISNARKTSVFTIRKGLHFNTGASVTAADVAYTINRILNPKLQSGAGGSFSAVVGAQDVLAGRALQASGITASGRTLTIKLTHPVGNFVEDAGTNLCVLPAGLPLQPEGVTAPVPSPAPYDISSYVPGQRIVLDRNTHYRGTRPQHVDRFVFDLTVDENQALDDVLDGTADTAWVPNPYWAARAPEFARRFGINKKRFFSGPGTEKQGATVDPATKRKLAAQLRKARAAFGDRHPDSLNRLELEDWRATLPAGSRHDVFRSLRQALSWAAARSLTSRDASAGIRNPKRRRHERREVTPFESWAEVEKIAGELDKRYRAIPIVGVGTGLRPEELFGLHRADVDR